MPGRRLWLRWTTGLTMLLVALVALGLEGVRLARLAEHYRRRAAWHATAESEPLKAAARYEAEAARCRKLADGYRRGRIPDQESDFVKRALAGQFDAESAARHARLYDEQADERLAWADGIRRRPSLAYYRTQRAKYEAAARYPWWTVPPEPPVPGAPAD